MSSRLSTREIAREEVHDLFHAAFNITEQLRAELLTLATDGQPSPQASMLIQRIGDLVDKLEASEEAIRARVLPILG